MPALIDFPHSPAHRPASRPARRARPAHGRTTDPAVLLDQAWAGLAQARREPAPDQRYVAAYLAALRAAAAMLALRGRPHRGRARPTSAWVLLASLAPELAEWAHYFAAGSATRAAAEAGVTGHVTQRAADDLVRQTAEFADLVTGAVADARPVAGT